MGGGDVPAGTRDHPIGRITALCGRDLDRAQQRRRAAGRSPTRYNDWQAMLDSGEIDAVIVATPNETHYEITMAALDRGLCPCCARSRSG